MKDDTFCPSKTSRHNKFYKIIGSSLLEYEKNLFKTENQEKIQADFRISTTTVPLELLEAFLEELLDWTSSDRTLYIDKGKFSIASIGYSFIFPFVASLIAGIFAFQQVFKLTLPLTACIIGLVIVGVLYIAPRTRTRRRFMFAQVLSREISRRRGQGGDQAKSKVVFGSFFDWKRSSTEGVARTLLH